MDFKRQHIYYLFCKLFKNIKEIIFLLIAWGLVSSSRGRFFMYIFIGIVVLNIFIAIVGWIREVYKIDREVIYAKRGIFVIKDVAIPFDKVQSIDISSSLLQRIFNVCKVEIETPGGNVAERDFQVIIPRSDAMNIKERVLNKASLKKGIEEGKDHTLESKKYKGRYCLSLKDIFLASITSTQITIGFSVLLGAFTFIADDIPEKYKNMLMDKTNVILESVVSNDIIYKVIVVTITLIILAFIISFLGMLVKYYNFSLSRDNKNLKISYGLLSTKEVTIPINRILYIDIKEGLIRKPLGLCEVKLSSIGYGNEQGEKAMLCPLIKKRELENLLEGIIPEISLNCKFKGVERKSLVAYVFVSIWFWTILSIPISISFKYGFLSIIAVLFALYIGILKFRENGIDYREKLLYIRVRKVALHTIIIPKVRVQGIETVENYISHKNNMLKLNLEFQDRLSIKNESIRGMNSFTVDKLLKWYSTIEY